MYFTFFLAYDIHYLILLVRLVVRLSKIFLAKLIPILEVLSEIHKPFNYPQNFNNPREIWF